MIKRFLPLLMLVFWVACTPKPEVIEKPTGLIEEKKMILILTDVHLIEGSRTGLTVMGDTLGIGVYYNEIFNKYNISKDQYEVSFDYYLKDPKKLDKMYEVVIENLSKLEPLEPESK